MGTTRKKYEIGGGVVLFWDIETNPFRYHSASRVPEPTATLYFARGEVSQSVANKAAGRVLGETTVVVTKRLIQLATRSGVKNWTEAVALCDIFCQELAKLLRERDRVVAINRSRKAASRSGRVFHPSYPDARHSR